MSSMVGVAYKKNTIPSPQYRCCSTCTPSSVEYASNEPNIPAPQRPFFVDWLIRMFWSWFSYFRSLIIYTYRKSEVYDHAEMCFSQGEFMMAYTSTETDGVNRRDGRTFLNTDYNFIWLRISASEYKTLCEFLDGKVNNRCRFDAAGTFRMPFCPKVPPDTHKFWCASFLVSALQQIGIFRSYECNQLDVDDIVALLQNHPRSLENIGNPYLVSKALQIKS